MKLKTVVIAGRPLSAMNNMVLRVNRSGESQGPELSFEQMDKILAWLHEGKEKTNTGIVTQTSGYYPEYREPECGSDRPEGEKVLAFGCWEVGTLAEFADAYERLKEVNKDPERKPNPDVFSLGNGYYLGIHQGSVWTTDEDGSNFYDEVTTVEDMKKVIVEMEHTRTIPVMKYTGQPAQIIIDGSKVYVKVGCVAADLEQTKKAAELLEAVLKRISQPKTEAGEVKESKENL